MAKISVILPAYNAEKTLRTAVESILSQQVPGMEIIIVNDGSADGTARLCHVLASENDCIHVITQKNAGICAARNRGLEAAGGEFIAFCDDDDLFWQSDNQLGKSATGQAAIYTVGCNGQNSDGSAYTPRRRYSASCRRR